MIVDAEVPSLVEDWTTALEHAEVIVERLRRVHPHRMLLLPETGHEAIRRAMRDAEDCLAGLHRAGRYVLGVDQYESFVLERDEERVRDIKREEQDG